MNDHSDTTVVPSAPPTAKLAAYFQPILALDTRRIVGYEVLGRQREGDGVRSLGPFFTDPRVPEGEQIRVDRLLRERAIARIGAMAKPPTLFINLKPSWIYRRYRESGELHTLHLLRKYKIDPANVIIEITEEEFRGSMAELNEAVGLYRDFGCRIAIDDVGSGFSNYDRIAQIRPHLLKVDIHLLKRSAYHHGYLGVLRSFSTLAEQMGASLLVEGVETREDLQRAIRIGARYVQGFLFAPAEPDFRDPRDFAGLIERELETHRRQRQADELRWLELSAALAESARASAIDRLLAEAGFADAHSAAAGEADSEAADRILERWLPGLNRACLRVYLCRENGLQLSSNLVREPEDRWRREERFRGSDWSWRPYFIPHLLQPDRTETMLSPEYADPETQAWIRTLSIPIGRRLVLFLDLRDEEA